MKVGVHHYNGKRNSRGKRNMSKVHKGLNSGNVEQAFKDVERITMEFETYMKGGGRCKEVRQ